MQWCLLGALAGLAAACGGDATGTEGRSGSVPSVAPLTTPATFVTVVVLDAQTSLPLAGTTTLTIGGPDAAQVVTAAGAALTRVVTTNGFAAFQLKDSAAPTVAAPLTLQLGVANRGYLSGGATVVITGKGGASQDIRLVKASFDGSGALAGAPAGVAGQSVVVASSSAGVLPASRPDGAFVLSIPASTRTVAVTTADGGTATVPQPAASITIPAGVRVGRTVTNAAGVRSFVPAATGPVSANVVAFTPESRAALAAFPGGFEVGASAGGGITGPSFFQTAGFAAFNFSDAAGNPIDRFSAPVTLSIEAPAGTRTPAGGALALGATIPVWSYDAGRAQWQSEGDATVTGQAANGNWILSFQAEHLSYWNLDYFAGACNITVNLTGRNGDDRYLQVELLGRPGTSWALNGGGGRESTFSARAPVATPGAVEVADFSSGTRVVVGRVATSDFCTASPVTVALSALAPRPQPRQIIVETREACADGSNLRAAPVFVHVYNRTTARYWGDITVDGRLVIQDDGQFRGENVLDLRSLRVTEDWVAEEQVMVLPASTTSQTASFTFTMPCNAAPTGGSGGSGGAGGGNGNANGPR